MSAADQSAQLERRGDEAAASGRLEEALGHYTKALRLTPTVGRLHAKGAGVYLSRANYAAAVSGFEQARKFLPQSVAVLNNLGCALMEAGRPEDGRKVLQQATALNPDYLQAHYNLGRLCERLGPLELAIASYDTTLRIEPTHEGALIGRAQIEANRGDEAACAQFLMQALSHHPNSHLVHITAAQLGLRTGQLNDAYAHARHAVALQPQDISGLTTLGSIASKMGRWAEARLAYEAAIKINPRHTYAWSAMLLAAAYQADLSPQEVFARHQKFGEILEAIVRPLPPVAKEPAVRIRLGYVSSDFREHACAMFLLPLMRAHDRAGFEVYAYSNNARDDAVTARFKASVDHWRDIRYLDDDAAARQIQADAIDVLIDCNGHTEGHRLPVFAREPAPFAVTYLGLPITTGLTCIDYRLTDALGSLPEEGNAFDTEELVRLPHGYATYAPLCDLPDVTPTPALAAGVVTFGSFNNRAKLTPATFDLWAGVLRAVPNSRLLLKDRTFVDRAAGANILQYFAGQGIAPERIEFLGMTSLPDNYRDYAKVDIALDPIPFNGYTTTCDALIMGVPVLAVFGDRYMARVSASVLSQIGLPDLIARKPGQLAEIAARLAADVPKLNDLRLKLRGLFQASPLGQPELVVRDIETFYTAVVRGAPPPFVHNA